MILIWLWFLFDFILISFSCLLSSLFCLLLHILLLRSTRCSLSLAFPLSLTCFVAAVDLLALCSPFLLLLAYFSHACGLWFAFACAVVLCLVLPICACREGGRVEESERERETERAALHRRRCCCWLTRWRIKQTGRNTQICMHMFLSITDWSYRCLCALKCFNYFFFLTPFPPLFFFAIYPRARMFDTCPTN